jgi:hypothetical protein
LGEGEGGRGKGEVKNTVSIEEINSKKKRILFL